MQPIIVKTSKAELLLVVVPDGAYELRMSVKKIDHMIYRIGENGSDWIGLPFPCELIALHKDMTEEQAMELVDRYRAIMTRFGGPIYQNYMNAYKDCYTALESLTSLIESEGLAWKNVAILKRIN